MKVINNEISYKGLGRDMVNKGLSDLKVRIGEEEISGVKSVLMNGNELFRKLLEDEKFNGVLEIFEDCTKESFLLLEMYYGGGCIDISCENVCEILKICIYYNEDRLIPLCEKFIINHPDDIVMIELFELLHLCNIMNLRKLSELSEKYLETNGLRFLSERELLLRLKIEDIEFILESPKLLIKDDTIILNQLLKWYKYMNKKEVIENEKTKEYFKNLLLNSINFNRVNYDRIKSDLQKELEDLKISINIQNQKNTSNEKSLDLSELNNETIEEIINKYYIEYEKLIIEEDDLSKIRCVNTNEIISKLLKNDDIKIIEIGLMIVRDGKINYNISYEEKSQLIGRLCVEYNKKKHERIIKCLCLFTNDLDFISTIKTLCGKVMLYRILNMKKYLKESNIDLIIKYLHSLILNENDENEINQIIDDEEILGLIKIKNLTLFSYPKNDYIFPPDEVFSINPMYDGSKCRFSVEPKLPNGVYLNVENGMIYGNCNSVIERKEYKVVCENKWNKLEFIISLECKYCLDESKKSDNVVIDKNKNQMKLSYIGFDKGYCFLNFKIDRGIYIIKYFCEKDIDFCLAKEKMIKEGEYDYLDCYNMLHSAIYINERYRNDSPNSFWVDSLIVDMNKRELSAVVQISSFFGSSQENFILMKDLPSPLYPFVLINTMEGSFSLNSVQHKLL